MYKATFMGKEKIKMPLPFEKHLENGSNKDEDESSNEYIKEVLGGLLGNILSNCALMKPEDPLTFIADALERLLRIYSAYKNPIFRNFLETRFQPFNSLNSELTPCSVIQQRYFT